MMPGKETKVGRWLIYGLICPKTKTLFYIGKTHKRRELRLMEHLEAATQGRQTPVHQRIRSMIADGTAPEIFVLRRIAPDGLWQAAEMQELAYWNNFPASGLPTFHPPQTMKSVEIEIRNIELLNVRMGRRHFA